MIAAEPDTDRPDPMIADEEVERVEPSETGWLAETVDPTTVLSDAEQEPPQRVADPTLSVLPRLTIPRVETLEPTEILSVTVSSDPSMALEPIDVGPANCDPAWTDRPAPIMAESVADTDEPTRTAPSTVTASAKLH